MKSKKITLPLLLLKAAGTIRYIVRTWEILKTTDTVTLWSLYHNEFNQNLKNVIKGI